MRFQIWRRTRLLDKADDLDEAIDIAKEAAFDLRGERQPPQVEVVDTELGRAVARAQWDPVRRQVATRNV